MDTPLSSQDAPQYRVMVRAAELAEIRIRTYLLARNLVKPEWLQERILTELTRMRQFDDTDS